MKDEKEKINVFLTRARKDYEDELKRNEDYLKKLAEIDGSTTE